jgi:large subunit ribosomal protein L23
MEKFTTDLDNYNLGNYLYLIKYPLITEKSTNLFEKGVYTFIVDKTAKKKQLTKIFELIFGVQIEQIRTSILPIRTRRVGKFLGKKSQYKKAYIKLKEGYSIPDLFN